MRISLLPFLLRDRGSHGRANSHKNRFYAKGVQRLIIWPRLSKTTEWLLELWWYSLKLICFTIFFPPNSICFRQKQNHLITVTQTERDSNFHFSGRIFRPLRSVFASANLGQKGTGIDSTNSLNTAILLQHLVLAAGSQLLPTQIIATLMSIPCFSPRSRGFHSDNRSK